MMAKTDRNDLSGQIAAKIRDIPDFPVSGVLFKDITPILASPETMHAIIADFDGRARPFEPDAIVGIESRGFLFAVPLALSLGVPFIPVRKPGKLPAETLNIEYELEYGTSALEIHRDALQPGQKVIVVDDLLATGGTSRATGELVRQLGAETTAFFFVIELSSLRGREALSGESIYTQCTF